MKSTNARQAVGRVTYNMPIAAPLPNSPTRRSGANRYLAPSKNDRPGARAWKIQADERLQLHKAYAEALQKKEGQLGSSFELVGRGSGLRRPAAGSRGDRRGQQPGKLPRAQGERWRQSAGSAGGRGSSAGGAMGDDPAGHWVLKREEAERGRVQRDQRREIETLRKREKWEIKSRVARETKRFVASGGQPHPWSENDHNAQARSLLTKTLKDKERLHTQNERLLNMAREAEVLSEKLRVAEGMVARTQTKLRNQEMFMKNMEMELKERVPIGRYRLLADENRRLKAAALEHREQLLASRGREASLQKQLLQISQMHQMLADDPENADMGSVVIPSPTRGRRAARTSPGRQRTSPTLQRSPTRSAAKSASGDAMKKSPKSPKSGKKAGRKAKSKGGGESKSDEVAKGSGDTTHGKALERPENASPTPKDPASPGEADDPRRKRPAPLGVPRKSPEKSPPGAMSPQSPLQGGIVRIPMPNNDHLGPASPLSAASPEADEATQTAVTLLQQYIRSLLSENQELKAQVKAAEEHDPKIDMFSDFVALKRENVRMRKIMAKMGVEPDAYVRKKKRTGPKVVTK